MTTRPNISSAIRGVNPNGGQPASPALPVARAQAATRVGKKMIAAPIDPAGHKQLKMLAAETERKSEDLIREALRDLFMKYGKLPIA
jgi:hypothetical protein